MKNLTSLFLLMILTWAAYAQNSSKIPFQGNLTEEGTPVNGQRKFVFSIDAVGWSETYNEVSITNGFYSVVLGSVTPLPDDLFDEVDSRQLSISVNDTNLGTLRLYAPFTTRALTPDSLVAQSLTAQSSLRVSNRLVYDLTSGDLKLFNEEGIEKLDLNIYEDNDAGSLVLYGNDDQRAVILGTSGARSGNTGFLGLYDSIGNQKASLRVDELDGSATGGVLSIRNNVINNDNFFTETIKLSNYNDAGTLILRDANNSQNIELYGENGSANFAGDVTITGNLNVSGSSMLTLPDSIGKLTDTDTGIISGFTSTITGTAVTTARGLYGHASTEGYNVGVHGTSESPATSTAKNNGLYGIAQGEGTGDHRGVLGYAKSAGKYNLGIFGIAEGAGNGDTGKNYGEGSINFGLEGLAGGNAWNNTGVEGSNYGTEGLWNFGVHGISNAGSTDSTENHGVAGRAFGPGINYGVFGQAAGGVENFAGYFEGDVKVTGNLTVSGSSALDIPDSLGRTIAADTGTVSGFSYTLNGDGRDYNYALHGIAKTSKYQIGVLGVAESQSGSTTSNTGAYGQATGEGTGSHRGMVGYANGTGKYTHGVLAIGQGTGNGDTGKGYGEGSISFGLEGRASSNTWNNTGIEGSNSGDYGLWNFGVHGISNAGSTDTTENHGVAGRAYGPGINYGIYGEAADGVTNWAGYFNGNVQTNGTLNVDGDIEATGTITGATSSPSDKRLKSNITPIHNALELTKQLSGVRYTWNNLASGNRQGKADIGVIAQEVEVVFPELVTETSNGYKAVNYAQLVAVLIESIKEMDDKITALQQENQSLKAELVNSNNASIAALRKEIESIKAILNLTPNNDSHGTE